MKFTACVAVVAFLAGGVTGWLIKRPVAPLGNPNQVAESTAAGPSAADLAGIEKLHKEDVAATLSGKPSELAKLWTDDAVRLEPGSPAEIGKKAITADDEMERKKYPDAQVASYAPQIELLKVVDGWAFEWDNFDVSFHESPRSKLQNFHAKALRVLRRQPDGSWKFAAVTWNLSQQ
jgi:ketosteroid isomerase-like protein